MPAQTQTILAEQSKFPSRFHNLRRHDLLFHLYERYKQPSILHLSNCSPPKEQLKKAQYILFVKKAGLDEG